MAKKKDEVIDTIEGIDTEVTDVAEELTDNIEDNEIENETKVEPNGDEVKVDPKEVNSEPEKATKSKPLIDWAKYSKRNIPIYITPDKGVLVARAENITFTRTVIGKFAQCRYRWGTVTRVGYTPITPEIKKLLM